MPLSWLESICDPDSPHEFCRRPYATVDLWGEAFAMDGRRVEFEIIPGGGHIASVGAEADSLYPGKKDA